MKNNNYIFYFAILFVSLINFFNTDVASASQGEFNTGQSMVHFDKYQDYREFYYENYGTMFANSTKIVTQSGSSALYANTDYLYKGHLIFGVPSDVVPHMKSKMPSITNDMRPVTFGLADNTYTILNGKSYRYLGLTVRGLYPFTGNGFKEDWDTFGDTTGRSYKNWRTNSCQYIASILQPDCDLSWNTIPGYYAAFLLHGKQVDYNYAGDFYNQQLDNFFDHYSVYYSNYYGNSSYKWFKEKDSDEIGVNTFATKFSTERKKSIGMIIQPATEASSGRFVEWHTGCGAICYDVFEIKSVPGIVPKKDFVGVSLTKTDIGGKSKLSFTVRFDGDEKYDTERQAINTLYLKVNGSLVNSHDFLGFDNVWEPGQQKTYTLPDSIDLSIFGPNDDVEIIAMFNSDGAIKEQTLINNSANIKIKGLDDTICYYNGVGELKNYEVQVCGRYATGTGTRADGSTYSYTYCAEYICSNRTYNLQYGSEVKYDKTRQDLMGLWSSNSFGHLNLSVPGATVSKPSNEEWRKIIEGHKVPGVDNLRRVLRAGRSIQLYGTVSVKITLEDYKESGLKSKRDKFYNALTKHSIIEGNDEGSGKVQNNVKETKDTVKYDSSRFKVQSKYIKYKEGEVIHTEYGYGYASSGKKCTVIDVYTQTFEFELPLRSNNLGGEQITSSKGDFYTSKNYNISSSKTDSYFVDINTQNGVHSVNFMMKMYEIFKEVDSNFSGGTKLCKSLPEKFGIQGNIYDDTRVEDVTEEEEGKNNFNF